MDNYQEEEKRLSEEELQLERLKLCFEGCKHIATLGVVAAGVILAIYQQAAADDLAVVVALACFGLSVLVSVRGLVVMVRFLPNRLSSIRVWPLTYSVGLFSAGLIFFMLQAFQLPTWLIFVLAFILAVLFRIWQERVRKRIEEHLNTEQEASAERTEQVESRSAAEEDQQDVQRPQERPWWRRMFGG